MDPTRDLFERPTLHIVLAEDEDYWADKIEQAIVKPVREWSLCQTGQFQLQVHRCPTVQDFQETVEPLLKTRALVYATLDLKMPDRRGDEQKDPRAGKAMVVWCLDAENAAPQVRQSFECCLISAEEASLDALYAEPDLRAKLRNRGVKRVYKEKNAVSSGVGMDLSLAGLWPDIREFVLKRIRFCTFPVRLTPADPETEPHPIWFDPRESPARLLVQADKIARQKSGGLYLIFSDAEGYDTDWFRLCCRLRGVEGRVRDFSKTVLADGTWGEDFGNPPPALLIRRLEVATSQGYDIHRVMKTYQFLGKVSGRVPADPSAGDAPARPLVFIQFPFFDTQLKVGGRLGEGDLAILEDCLREIYRQNPPFPEGIGFAYADHDHIIAFPDYEKGLKPSVIPNTIAFQAHQQALRHGLEGVALDPEVVEVMGAISWNEVGLGALHAAIRVAYQAAAKVAEPGRRYVTIEAFAREGIVRKQFDSELGFRVRGRRLFRLLEQNGPEQTGSGSAAEDGLMALASLETIHELLVALVRLVQLKEHLQRTSGEIRYGSDFTDKQFQALEKAHDFLRSIFDTPNGAGAGRSPTQWLHDRIEEFRPHAGSVVWRHYYPGLRHRKGWVALVEHIEFTWPFAQLPLHRAVNHYLSDSGIIYEILTDPVTVLNRWHQDLLPRWDKLEKARKDLLRQVHGREEQRRAAATYVRQHHSQPVVVHLDTPEEGPQPTESVLLQALQSLVYFNAYLAICENHHVFGGKHCKPDHIKSVRTHVQLGDSFNLLCNYLHDLAGELTGSVFRYWTPDWPRRDQRDALRVASGLAEQILKARAQMHPDPLTRDEEQLFLNVKNAPSQGRLGVPETLRFLTVIRNAFEKLPQHHWVFVQNKADIWDLLRRFVAATSAPIRLGVIDADKQRARLWTRRGWEIVPLTADPRFQEGDSWIFEAEKVCIKPLFRTNLPDGDPLRLHPEGHSVLSWYGKSRWINLCET